MASIGRLTLAGLSTVLESTQALAAVNFDFSIVKVPPPQEFQGLGQCLEPTRRDTAEHGMIHLTARRLGAIFESVLPKTPELIKRYGLRASEIAKESTDKTPGSLGIFTQQAGIDGTSIWASATSGVGAIQVHLLACMLARMWSAPEATSIWVELLDSRRREIQASFDGTGSMHLETLVASQQQIDRSHLAEWDASARAWIRIADSSKAVQQKQLLLIIGNLDRSVNSKPGLYESVIKAWRAGLEGMEALVNNSPIAMPSGDILLALSSWHIYPDLNVLVASKIVRQADPLVPESGILTIGMQQPLNSTTQPNGLRWSLPLAYLRFYGDPVTRTAIIRKEGSRLHLAEFQMAVLGSLLGGWRVPDHQLERAIKWVGWMSKTIISAIPNDFKMAEKSSLAIFGRAADSFLASVELERKINAQLLNLGRRCPGFLGRPSTPFFGLGEVQKVLEMTRSTEYKLKTMRSLAAATDMGRDRAIIRYVNEETLMEEYASAVPQERSVGKRAASPEETKPNTCHVRWMYGQRRASTVHGTTSSRSGATGRVRLNQETDDAIHAQREKYIALGEQVRSIEDEPLLSLVRSTKVRRVIWGIPQFVRSLKRQYDHWNGPMKHYEYWVGEPEVAAMFIRMDHAKPSTSRITFEELCDLTEQDAFEPDFMAKALSESFQTLEESYRSSLRAFSIMVSIYEDLPRATVDVRVLENQLAKSEWIKTVGLPNTTTADDAMEVKAEAPDEALGSSHSQDDSNAFRKGAENVDNTLLNPTQDDSTSVPDGIDPNSDFLGELRPPGFDMEDSETEETNAPKVVRMIHPNAEEIYDPEVEEMNLFSVMDDMDEMGDMDDMDDMDEMDDPEVQEMDEPDMEEINERKALELRMIKAAAKELLHKSLVPVDMDTSQTYSCILWFESLFDVAPTRLKNIMAISSGNSLFISADLITDPTASERHTIKHIMGNIGRPGTALLIPPSRPRVKSVGLDSWRLMNFDKWDGVPRDCFQHSSLHLWFTGWVLELDVGYSGAQDKELYLLESVVSLHSRGEWIADLDILATMQKSRALIRHWSADLSLAGKEVMSTRQPTQRGCDHGPLKKYDYDRLPLAAVEVWPELLENEDKACIVLAWNNWQARLAAMMICVSQGRETCLLPDEVCWHCISTLQQNTRQPSKPLIYIH